VTITVASGIYLYFLKIYFPYGSVNIRQGLFMLYVVSDIVSTIQNIEDCNLH